MNEFREPLWIPMIKNPYLTMRISLVPFACMIGNHKNLYTSCQLRNVSVDFMPCRVSNETKHLYFNDM